MTPETPSTSEGNMSECGGCRFWKVIVAGGSYQGQCKRRAPSRDILITMHTTHIDSNSNRALWPMTRQEDGCGDFVAHREGEAPTAVQRTEGD